METVKCPLCGMTVLASALEFHKRVCKGKPPEPAVAAEKTPVAKATKETPVAIAEHRIEVIPEEEKGEVCIPPAEPSFWIDRAHVAALNRIAALSETGVRVNVLLRGPKGCGKTTLPRQFAAKFRRPFHEVHCGAMVDVEQWFGKDRLTDGETFYRKARFVEAIEKPFTVLELDEVNRSHPEVMNGIFGFLDWRRSMWNDDLGYNVKVGRGVVIFATINEGEDYYGTNPLDAALRDRFSRVLKLSYPPKKEEAKILMGKGADKNTADKLVLLANTLRKSADPVAISPRQLLTALEELKHGATLREAVELSIVNGLEEVSTEKMALEALQWLEDNPYVGDEMEVIRSNASSDDS